MPLHYIFTNSDENGDGIFSLEELRTLLKPAFGDLSDVFDRLDRNKDGKLSYEDFESHINSIFEEPRTILEELRSMDTDGNRKISLSEFKTGVKRTYISGQYKGTQEELEQEIDDGWPKLMKSLGKNNDNQINVDEIKDTVKDVVQMALRAVDTNGDDKVSLEELQHIANPDTLPETLMSIFDENGDGDLSYKEFMQAGDLDVVNTVTQALGRLDAAVSGGGITEPSVESSGKVALPGRGVPIVYEGVLTRKVGLPAGGGGSVGQPKRLRIELAVQVDDESDE